MHRTGRNSSIFIIRDIEKLNFHPYFIRKDSINISLLLVILFMLLRYPFILGDPEIFIAANQIKSPIHIVPEIYFLFAYCILRSIPNKLIGVFALLARVLILYLFIFFNSYSTNLSKLNNFIVYNMIRNRIILT